MSALRGCRAAGKGLDEEAAAGLRLAKERKKQAKKQKFALPGSADGLTVLRLLLTRDRKRS